MELENLTVFGLISSMVEKKVNDEIIAQYISTDIATRKYLENYDTYNWIELLDVVNDEYRELLMKKQNVRKIMFWNIYIQKITEIIDSYLADDDMDNIEIVDFEEKILEETNNY